MLKQLRFPAPLLSPLTLPTSAPSMWFAILRMKMASEVKHVSISLGKRQSKRTKSVVPVQFWIAGSKESHLAHTLDVSNNGVRLGGFRGELKVGDNIEIHHRHDRAHFRVVWITAREGFSEKEIGAQCLEPMKQVWGAGLPEQTDEYEEKEC